ALLWASAWAALAVFAATSTVSRALLLVIAALVPLGLGLHVWSSGRGDLSAAELVRIAFWPPEWWGMWWPRALRRPNDLWRRLPWPARTVRVVLSVFLFALPTMILLRDEFEAAVGRGGELPWFGMSESGLVIGSAIATS